jgi:hypothetical protein
MKVHAEWHDIRIRNIRVRARTRSNRNNRRISREDAANDVAVATDDDTPANDVAREIVATDDDTAVAEDKSVESTKEKQRKLFKRNCLFVDEVYEDERKVWIEQLQKILINVDDARNKLLNSNFYDIINIKLLWYNKGKVTLEEEIERILDNGLFEEKEDDEYDSENEVDFDEEDCFRRPDEESL